MTNTTNDNTMTPNAKLNVLKSLVVSSGVLVVIESEIALFDSSTKVDNIKLFCIPTAKNYINKHCSSNKGKKYLAEEINKDSSVYLLPLLAHLWV